MSEVKNIKRNRSRPNASQVPFCQGRGYGKKKDREELETQKKLESWNKLSLG